MLNQKKKSVLLIVLFFVIAYVLQYVIGILLTPENKQTIQTYRMNELRNVYAEDNDTIDVFVVGHSGVYRGYNPMKTYDEFGITSYNLAKSTQSPIEAYELIVETLKYQSPKVIILNMDEFAYDRPENLAKIYGLKALDVVFPIFNVHSRWREVLPPQTTIERSITKNYMYRDDVRPYKGKKIMKQTDKVHKLYGPWLKYLNKIKDLCNENGITLILMELPSKMQWTTQVHNAFDNYAKENNLEFIDFNFIEDEVGIDWQTDTFDKGDHMNVSGANKISVYLGQHKKEVYHLEDHRGNEKYKTWDEDLIKYKEMYEK